MPAIKTVFIHALPILLGLLGVIAAVYSVVFVGCFHYDCVNSDYRWHVASILFACLCLFAYDLYVLARLLSQKIVNPKIANVFKLCIMVIHVGLFLSVFVVFDYVTGRI